MDVRNQLPETPAAGRVLPRQTTTTGRGPRSGRKTRHALLSRAAFCVAVVFFLAVSGVPAPAQRLDARFEVGKPFPELTLPSLEDGTRTSIADFRGKKVLLHVFASW